ncbi:hypothetical protein NBRC116601_11860 [Cognatishimia sp. WU-CL00825]|uniref:hypothetical protein n=1 Tax=Cognatishimia sp. WU-CL00825 TaxID=3127658 RepID=UPI0031051705
MAQEYIDPKRQAARQSFTGSRVSESQFEMAQNLGSVIHAGIWKDGDFFERLKKYSEAFADTQKFDEKRAEIIIRDVYTAYHGHSMNALREELRNNRAALQEAGEDVAQPHVQAVKHHIKDGKTMSYGAALDTQAVAMSRRFRITENTAMSMMHESNERETGRSLSEIGKELENQYHRPVRDAERAARQTTRSQIQRSGPSL